MNNQISIAAPVINITPLIDILLVLLIIFMVISPLKPARFETKLPAEPDNVPADANINSLVVTVDKNLQLKLNRLENLGTVNDTSALSAELVRVFAERKQNGVLRETAEGLTIEKTVFIKAPRTASYGEIAKVVDGVKGAGAHPIGLQIDDLEQ
jgi:biopolymer transport protein ExbD